MRTILLKALAITVLLDASGARWARADNLYGTIRGTITDSSGAVIVGAKLTATNTATGIAVTVTSGPSGYEFLQLAAPGTYEIRAEMGGFQAFEAKGILLQLNQNYPLDIKMEVGKTTQTITVEAEPAKVETSSIQLGADITSQAAATLPLNGRNWVQLQQTLPGVVAASDRFSNNFSTNGARSQANGYLVNGTDANDLPLNSPLDIPSPDAIADVHVVTNTLNPEFGHNSGAVLNAETKSGTNAFHGDGFEFFRDTSLNTRNFFSLTPTVFHQNQFGGTIGGPIKKDKTFFFFSYQGTRARQPSVNPGGDTTVYTADQRAGMFPDLASSSNASPIPLVGDNGQTYAAGTPYSTIFSQGTIPTVDMNPVAANLVNKYVPLPNAPGGSYEFNPITTSSTNQELGRIDENISARDSVFGYFFISRAPSQDGLSFDGATLPGFAEKGTSHIYQYTLALNHTFSATALNELRLGYNRFNFNTIYPVNPVTPSSVGFTGIDPQSAAGASLPFMGINGFFNLGFSYQGPQPRVDQTYQLTDNFTKVAGGHTLKFGFDMRRAEVYNPFSFVNNGYFGFEGTGTYSTGDAGADFLLGFPDFYEQTSGNVINARTQEYYLYAQDQWKVRHNLTLTYGAGYQIDTPLTDNYNNGLAIACFRPGEQSSVFPTAPTGMVFPGDSNCTESGYGTNYDHIGPRAGFAWSPGNSGKWSIRAGAGIYYNVSEEELTLQNLLEPPFSLTSFGAGDQGLSPAFANPYESVTQTSTLPNKFPFTPPAKGAQVNFPFYEPMTLNVLDPKFTTPRSYNYNLTIERELPGSMIVSAGYVGLLGRHLENTLEMNPAGQVPGNNPSCAAIAGCNPFTLPFVDGSSFRYNPLVFGSVGQQQTDANSNYNSLQLTINKHFSHGLQFMASYSWAHALDYGSSFEDAEGLQNPFAPYLSYGDSDYDARNRFVISYIYAVPSVRRYDAFHWLPSRLTDGWQLAGITTLQSGFPITLSDSSDNSFTCNENYSKYGCPDRPNTIGPVDIANPRTNSLTYNYGVSSLGGSASLPNYWFNPNSFEPEAPGLFGDSGRNFFHGPGLNDTDFSLLKDVKVTESTKFQLRFEFFNFLNHPNFAKPDSNVSDPNFGRILDVLSPYPSPSRVIQLAGKFFF
jgi:hypothetical protein